MKKSTLFTLFCLFSALPALPAQDFTFSQYQALPYLVNPAETGNFQKNSAHRLSGVFRTHWESPVSENALFGEAVGWDMRLCAGRSENSFWSIGAFAQHEGTGGGGIYHLQGRALASFNLSLGENIWMAAGFSAGYFQYGIRPEKLTFNLQYDPATGDFDPDAFSGEAFKQTNGSDWDADAGIRILGVLDKTADLQTETWWSAGIALHHIPKPRYTFLEPQGDEEPNRLDRGLSVQATLQPLRYLAFNGLYRRQSLTESRQWQVIAGAAFIVNTFKANHVLAGMQVRVSGGAEAPGNMAPGALIPFAKIDLEKTTLRLSWDIPFHRFGNRQTGGMEISATCYFGDARCPVECPGMGQ